MNKILKVAAILSVFFVIQISGQNDSLNIRNQVENSMIEIDGLIVNDTQSKIANDFFDMFYQNWQAPLKVNGYQITISEKPMPQLGTRVSLIINDNLVFQKFVQPRYEVIEESVQQALYASYQYLINYEEIQRALQTEELQGTGIY